VDAATLNAVTWTIPNALCLVGSGVGDDWNGMTLSWVTQVSMEPVLIAIGVDRSAVTNGLIRDGEAFSVNLWDREDTRVFRSFSKPAIREGSTLNGRPVRAGLTGVPIFEEAVAWLECRVFQTVEFTSHDLFVGEVVDAGFREGSREVPVARMEDTRMKYGGVRRGKH
jgi:flavin reductase (DIM6/NTAB) family NADH-FMN oxidoreductase RutF